MTAYYHGSLFEFPIGHIINSGGHGDRHRRFMFPQLTHLFESTCEDIRASYFPLKPSRFSCIFACENPSDLDVFCRKYSNRSHYYEIEPVDPSAKLHRGTWELTSAMSSTGWLIAHGSIGHNPIGIPWKL
jgi:hypothetical protein